MKKPKRSLIPYKLRKELSNFFGDECVICGKEKLFVEIAHTNDRREESVFGNLIPLCFNANRGIQRATYRSASDPTDEIDPVNVVSHGHKHFRNRHFPQAYGCYRLASHLYDRKSDASRSVECLNFSIGAIRPIAHANLLAYTVRYIATYIEKHPVIAYWRADFLNQLALVMLDYRRFDEMAEIGALAEQLLLSCKGSIYPEEYELAISLQKRRIAASKGDLKAAGPLLAEAKSIQEKAGDSTALATSLHVEATLELKKHGITIKAYELVREALSMAPKVRNVWPLAELHFLRGYIDIQNTGPTKKRGIDHLRISFDLFVNNSIVPEPLRINDNLLDVTPAVLLKQLGLRPLGEMRKRDYFPIEKSEIRGITRTVFQNAKGAI